MFAVMYNSRKIHSSDGGCRFVAIMVERILNARRTNEDLIASLALLVYPVSLLACFGLVGFGRNDISRAAFLCIFAGPCMAGQHRIHGRFTVWQAQTLPLHQP